jgi:hypothetical protein
LLLNSLQTALLASNVAPLLSVAPFGHHPSVAGQDSRARTQKNTAPFCLCPAAASTSWHRRTTFPHMVVVCS